MSATSNFHIEQNLLHWVRFLCLSEKLVGVILKTEAFVSNFQFSYRAKFSALGVDFLHFSEKVVGVILKTEAFSSSFQFMYRAKFSAFG